MPRYVVERNFPEGLEIPSGDEGVQVCEHLPEVAKIFDRFVPVRTVNHNVIDEHAAAVNRMHTGHFSRHQ